MRTINNQLLLHPMTPDGVIIQEAGAPNLIQQEPPQNHNQEPPAPVDEGNNHADEDEAFDISAFEALKKDPSTTPPAPKKEEEVAKEGEEVVKEEVKKVETTTPEAKKVVTPPTKQTPLARDYNDIEEGDRDLFKNMSNQAFAKLKPVYLEHKRLQQEKAELEASLAEAKKAGLPESYYENPSAYVFDKEYQTAEQSLNLVGQVAAHWQEQMQLIEKGKDWKDLTWDNTQNKFVLSAPLPASPENRVAVLTAYQRVLGQQTHFEQQVNNLRTNYVQRHQETVSNISQLADQLFPSFKEDKSEHALVAKDVEAKLPKYMKGNPITKIVARSLATNILLTKRVQELLAQVPKTSAAKAGVSATKRAAGPTNGDMGAAHVEQVDGGDEVTIDDFNRLKAGL